MILAGLVALLRTGDPNELAFAFGTLAHYVADSVGHELGTNRKFDLDHMRVLADALGHPERRFASILIAGTNGKGSTAATLASILQTAGHRTGLYTSPHLRCINERIRVNGEQISDPEFTGRRKR